MAFKAVNRAHQPTYRLRFGDGCLVLHYRLRQRTPERLRDINSRTAGDNSIPEHLTDRAAQLDGRLQPPIAFDPAKHRQDFERRDL